MFTTFFYEPIYNLLVATLEFLPFHDVGAAIIIVTLVIKALLLPINLSALRSQIAMKRVEKEMNDLKEEYKKDPRAAALKMQALYKREGIRPFSSILGLLIQIPIIFALFLVFKDGFVLHQEHIYAFLHFPEMLHTKAFGILDMTDRSILLALLAGVSSYFLAKRQTASMVTQKPAHEETMQDHFMKSMRIQLLYVLPVLLFVSALYLPAALGLYWTVGNVATFFQDVYIRRKTLAH